MTCNCCANLHKTTSLTAAGLLTVTNSTNVGNFDPFCLLLTINPDSVITTAPVAYNVTVNDVNVPIVDIWGYPVMTDRLRTRKVYKGRYVIVGDTPHVTLINVPCDEAAIASTIAATATASTTDGD